MPLIALASIGQFGRANACHHVNGYRIWIKFSDELSGIVDFTDIIHNYAAARPLAEQNEFQRFYLDDWPTLAWPCGFDFSPESLYERATGKSVP